MMRIGREQVPDHVTSLISHLHRRGIRAYPVGGALRDILLGRVVREWDLAAAACPEVLVKNLPRAVPTGIRHGTITAIWKGRTIEITAFRGEDPGTYHDGRRPDHVRFGVSLAEDLSRRDFTINAMALDPVSWRLVDPFGGRTDLERKTIRCVGNPLARFSEDGLRPLRAIRFAAVLGFSIHRPTMRAIPATLATFKKVSSERVRDEILKMFAAERPSRGIEIMRRTGMLAVIFPEILAGIGMAQNRWHRHDVYRHSLKTLDETQGDPILRLAALLHDVAKPCCIGGAGPDHTFYGHDKRGAVVAAGIAARLKLSRVQTERVATLSELHMFSYSPEWRDGTVRRFVARAGKDLVPDLLELQRADIIARGTHVRTSLVSLDRLRQRIDSLSSNDLTLKVTDLAVDGRDVMRVLGVRSSPLVGTVLRRLLERVIDDPSLNRRRVLLDLIPREAY